MSEVSIRVDFYILPDAKPQGRLHFTCRLAERAYREGLTVYIHTASPAEAETLDDLLWTFKDHSFVPHARHPAEPEDTSPILIGSGNEAPAMAMLINLCEAVPGFAGDFQRVAEVVDQHPEVLQASRERFKAYRELGVEPTTHKL